MDILIFSPKDIIKYKNHEHELDYYAAIYIISYMNIEIINMINEKKFSNVRYGDRIQLEFRIPRKLFKNCTELSFYYISNFVKKDWKISFSFLGDDFINVLLKGVC